MLPPVTLVVVVVVVQPLGSYWQTNGLPALVVTVCVVTTAGADRLGSRLIL